VIGQITHGTEMLTRALSSADVTVSPHLVSLAQPYSSDRELDLLPDR
jgi:hypothetical protein